MPNSAGSAGRVRKARLRGVEDAVEVGVDDILPLRLFHAEDEGVPGDACVVDQDLDRIGKCARRRLEESRNALRRGHVRLHSDTITPKPLDLLDHLLRCIRRCGVVDHHTAALRAKLERNGTTQAAATTGDDADRAVGGHLERGQRAAGQAALRRRDPLHAWRESRGASNAEQRKH